MEFWCTINDEYSIYDVYAYTNGFCSVKQIQKYLFVSARSSHKCNVKTVYDSSPFQIVTDMTKLQFKRWSDDTSPPPFSHSFTTKISVVGLETLTSFVRNLPTTANCWFEHISIFKHKLPQSHINCKFAIDMCAQASRVKPLHYKSPGPVVAQQAPRINRIEHHTVAHTKITGYVMKSACSQPRELPWLITCTVYGLTAAAAFLGTHDH